MNKKEYQAPALLLINISPKAAMLLDGSKTTVTINTSGEKHSAGEAMSRQSDWDDWDE